MKIFERLERLPIRDLEELSDALHFLCPCADCIECPLYNGEYDKYHSGCLAIQADMEYNSRKEGHLI